ncbi:NAD(P)-dependent oxidoreductase [Micromonospora sp. 15K316]|uniref:NAD(P)-dependent oxidoreductase n=1 Tax=Micromonospora sp. 15K316 TaxID=2530376 RepID=UPI00104CEFDC|nr:NAD(P)-dependent oxidoreductase [Micromonospora sp. 15K316]TDC38786.1 NAD(P)-dependent oxidoreductase [Micromonospora sp. 15K316]
MQIGFIGLGAMGSAMVTNLLAAGHPVRVWNRSPEPVREMTDRGATAADLAEIYACDVVLSALSDDGAVGGLLLDEELLAVAPPGAVHVNTATISTELAARAHQRYSELGLRYVAAPVLGNSEVARAGNLTVLVAGEAEAIAVVQPLIDVIGRRSWTIGDQPPQANLLKILVNYLIACSIGAMAEATTVTEAAELDPKLLIDIVTDQLFTGVVFPNYGRMIAAREYEPVAFKLALGHKDVNLALDTGQAHGVPLPLGAVVRDAFIDAMAHGQSDQHWLAVTEAVRRRAGLDRG